MTKKVYVKLSNIQRKLIAPKGEYNSFGKYPYRSCEDVLKAVKPLLDEYKCALFLDNELINMGDRFYVEATATLVDLEDGDMIEVKAQAREEESKKGMDGSQVTGASSSYARKYALAGLFCIDNEKDSDATNDTVREQKTQGHATQRNVNKVTEETSKALTNQQAVTSADGKAITSAQKTNIINLSSQKNVNAQQILSRYKVKSLDELTYAQANDCITCLMNTK